MPSINPAQNFINPSTWSPSGRIGRQRFIATILILFLISSVICFVLGFVMALAGASGDAIVGASYLVGAIASIPMVFSYIKRCRDAGISPHWTWVCLIPFVWLPLSLFLCFKGSEPLPSE